MQLILSIAAILIGLVLLLLTAWNFLSTRRSVSLRLEDGDENNPSQASTDDLDPAKQNWLRAWLFRAGFRRADAAIWFLAATAGAGLTAGGLILMIWRQGYFALAAQFISEVPGGIGNVLIPFVFATPWALFIIFSLLPTLYVRSVRRQRVRSVEKDLPLLLDLLETLAQAGIGFDSALDRILEVQDQKRPLVSELRIFQYENIAGRSRIESLRRLMRRLDVPIFSTFISAIIQAEQTGSAIGATLKTQSAEMRARRREKAAAAAMSVPTLLVIPMVIGFLPGIFVILLGPMLSEALGVLEQSFRSAMGQ